VDNRGSLRRKIRKRDRDLSMQFLKRPDDPRVRQHRFRLFDISLAAGEAQLRPNSRPLHPNPRRWRCRHVDRSDASSSEPE
jgi:hypothetical protein